MKILGIDDEKCIKCLECVKDCPMNLYTKPETKTGENRRVFFGDPLNSCNECGHCISLCPTGAIRFESGESTFEFEEAHNPSAIVDFDTLLKVLRSRRSIRQYKKQAVPKEEIEAVLNAIRYAPSASNAQSWEFIVLTDPEKIETLRKSVVNMMLLMQKLLRFVKVLKPLIPKGVRKKALDPSTKSMLEDFLASVKKGEDPIFYNAPVVIITYAPEYGAMAGNDAGIAFTYGMLAAQARGLGTCWIGFAQEALHRFKKNRQWLEIPKHKNVNGVLILGYPSVKFRRVPPRHPAKVRWY